MLMMFLSHKHKKHVNCAQRTALARNMQIQYYVDILAGNVKTRTVFAKTAPVSSPLDWASLNSPPHCSAAAVHNAPRGIGACSPHPGHVRCAEAHPQREQPAGVARCLQGGVPRHCVPYAGKGLGVMFWGWAPLGVVPLGSGGNVAEE